MTPEQRLGHALAEDELTLGPTDFAILAVQLTAIPRNGSYGSQLTEELWRDLATWRPDLALTAYKSALGSHFFNMSWLMPLTAIMQTIEENKR